MLVTQSQKKFIIGFKTLAAAQVPAAFSGLFFKSVSLIELGIKAFNRVKVPKR
jgi:hypothetical protein